MLYVTVTTRKLTGQNNSELTTRAQGNVNSTNTFSFCFTRLELFSATSTFSFCFTRLELFPATLQNNKVTEREPFVTVGEKYFTGLSQPTNNIKALNSKNTNRFLQCGQVTHSIPKSTVNWYKK